MRKIVMMLGLFMSLQGSYLLAAEAEPLLLRGKWGLGFDNLPGLTSALAVLPGISSPNAASLRYWVNERLGVEALLALDVRTQPSPGGASTTRAGGLGLSMRYNFKRPIEELLPQFMLRITMSQLAQTQENPDAGNPGSTTNTLTVRAGLGYEAFLPFLRALSFEGNLGLEVSASQTQTQGLAQAGNSTSGLAMAGSGFTPFTMALHYYF